MGDWDVELRGDAASRLPNTKRYLVNVNLPNPANAVLKTLVGCCADSAHQIGEKLSMATRLD